MNAKNKFGSDVQAPLIVWLWAIAFLCQGIIIIGHLKVRHEHDRIESQSFEQFNTERIKHFVKNRDNEELPVILLGNSRLKYALAEDITLQQWSIQNGIPKLSFFRLVNDWAIYSDFVIFEDQYLALKPRFVIFQSDMLAIDRRTFLLSFVNFRNIAQWVLFRSGPLDSTVNDNHRLQYDKTCFNDLTEHQFEEHIVRIGRLFDVDRESYSGVRIRKFIQKLLDNGSIVIFLQVPKTKRMEGVFPSDIRRFIDHTDRNRFKHKKIYYAQYDGPELGDEYYCDPVHLNETGRKLFSEWLLSYLSNIESELESARLP